jgi:hypothetical protein
VRAEVAMIRASIAAHGAVGTCRSRWRLIRVGMAGVGMLVIFAGSALATLPTPALPPDLPEADRLLLQQVTDHVSVASRSDGKAFLVRTDMFEYLLDHPEFATHVMRALEIARFRIWREPDGLWLDDGAGALVRFHTIYASHGSRVFYLQGRYQPPVLPAIHGRVVVILEYRVEPTSGGKGLITPALASFVRIDNGFIEALTRLFAAVVAPRATKVTSRIVVDIAKTARAIESDPLRVDDALRRRPDVPPHELAEFRRLLARK